MSELLTAVGESEQTPTDADRQADVRQMVVAGLARTAATAPSVEAALQGVSGCMQALVPHDCALLFDVDPSRRAARVTALVPAARGRPGSGPLDSLPLDGALLQLAQGDLAAAVCVDTSLATAAWEQRMAAASAASCLAVALRPRGSDLLGLLSIGSLHAARSGATEVDDLCRLAPATATALRHVQERAPSDELAVPALEGQAEQEKMLALTRMAGGIAHQFRNTLAAIIGNVQVLRTQAGRGPQLDLLEDIETKALLGVQSLASLQKFAGGVLPEPVEALDLNAVVREVSSLTRAMMGVEDPTGRERVTVEVRAGEPQLVRGNRRELRELLLNVLFNAVEAVRGPGLVEVCVERHADEWAVVVVRDTGRGMSKEIRRRAREPFFTTKSVEGAGLGLSIANGIADRHGGQIAIDSKPGAGTTVRVFLPLL